MNVATACLLILTASAAEAEPKHPLTIAVVHSPSNFLVNYAEVAIYAPNGQCIRRGQTGLFGEPYQAEARQRLDPTYGTLRVVVRKTFGPEIATATATLVYEKNMWRRPSGEGRQTGSGSGSAPAQLVSSANQGVSNGPVEVYLKFNPLPVCRMPPWQAYVCGCGAAPCDPGCPTCVNLVPFPPPRTSLPPAIPPISGSIPPASVPLAQHAAAITDLGLAPTPRIPWADYGSTWVRGSTGTYWEVRVLPPNVDPPASGSKP